jgi:multiple sugar transport system substrate-binding protein
MGDDALHDVQVCVEEALANLILHARAEGAAKDIEIEFAPEANGACVVISDACVSFDVSAAPLPEGAHVAYGGAFYAMPRLAAPSRKALAWEFIQLLTLDPGRQLSAFKSYDAFPALLETHDDPFFDEPLPFLAGQKARLLWRTAARRIGATPVHKQDGFADEVVFTELDKVMDRGKDIRVALADAQRLLERRAHR